MTAAIDDCDSSKTSFSNSLEMFMGLFLAGKSMHDSLKKEMFSALVMLSVAQDSRTKNMLSRHNGPFFKTNRNTIVVRSFTIIHRKQDDQYTLLLNREISWSIVKVTPNSKHT